MWQLFAMEGAETGEGRFIDYLLCFIAVRRCRSRGWMGLTSVFRVLLTDGEWPPKARVTNFRDSTNGLAESASGTRRA